MKKVLCLFVILTLAITALLVACNSKNSGEQYLTYTLNEDGNSYTVSIFNEEMITKYSSKEEFFTDNEKILAIGRIEIPSQYEGKPVTSIGYGAFAFIALEEIVIPDSVTSIGDYAFSGCTKLTRITIPDSVTYIGEGAFVDCAGLTSITIPNSVTTINNYAFAGCASLTSITIPDNVTSIGNSVFLDCTGITEITVGENNTACFSQDGIVYLKADNSILSIPRNISGDVTIADGVTTIQNYAFKGCANITSITIPDSVTYIGEGVLQDCTGLTQVTLPYIGEIRDNSRNAYLGYFFGASTLADQSDYVPQTLTTVVTGGSSIHNYAFDGCAGLMSVTILDGVTSIGDCAFRDCVGLENINISGSVTSIGEKAFENCIKLESIDIPEGVTTIGDYAFTNCIILRKIKIPTSMTSIGDAAFNMCNLYRVDISDIASWCQIQFEDNPLSGIKQNGLYLNGEVISGDLIIPEGVTSIGEMAFSNCIDLKSVIIPDSVTSIGYGAFDGCVGLKSITLPDSVTCIGDRAFEGIPYWACNKFEGAKYIGNNDNPYLFLVECENQWIKSVKIHENTKLIASYAFKNCTELTSVNIPDGVIAIGNSAFGNCPRLRNITVNKKNPVYHSMDNCLIETETGILIAGCNASSIPDGVISIGYCAFADCTEITSITIPDSVTSIAGDAFARCKGLTSITIPDSVTSIAGYAFYETELTDIYFTGTEEEWAAIDIEKWGNDVFLNATIHYNYVPEE